MEQWKAEKIVKAFFGFLTGILNIFAGIDPMEAMTGLEELATIIQLMEELFKLLQQIQSVLNFDVDFDDDIGIDDITTNPTTDFTEALQSAVKLKLKLPKFDEMRNFADDTLKRIDDITNHEIKGTDKLITAYKNVADVGKRLANEVSRIYVNSFESLIWYK